MSVQIVLDGDITFVKGWQRVYGRATIDPVTKVAYPAGTEPTKTFYNEQFPAIDALITTPRAFCILAPWGWNGERSWYAHDALVEHGWEPLGWKESSHKDQTWVQMYMRTLPRPEPKDPVFVDADSNHNYVGQTHKGTIQYMGCSSILSSFAKPRDKFEIPKPTGCYGGVEPEKFLHFIRQRRPGSIYSMSLLKKEGFRSVYKSSFCHYWLRAKPGTGTKEACEY